MFIPWVVLIGVVLFISFLIVSLLHVIKENTAYTERLNKNLDHSSRIRRQIEQIAKQL